MTVKELKEELENYDENLNIHTLVDEFGIYPPLEKDNIEVRTLVYVKREHKSYNITEEDWIREGEYKFMVESGKFNIHSSKKEKALIIS